VRGDEVKCIVSYEDVHESDRCYDSDSEHFLAFRKVLIRNNSQQYEKFDSYEKSKVSYRIQHCIPRINADRNALNRHDLQYPVSCEGISATPTCI
jgi:hypothetical protein